MSKIIIIVSINRTLCITEQAKVEYIVYLTMNNVCGQIVLYRGDRMTGSPLRYKRWRYGRSLTRWRDKIRIFVKREMNVTISKQR